MNWLLLFQVIGKLVAYKCVGPKFDSWPALVVFEQLDQTML
jgi:hypothetical protein